MKRLIIVGAGGFGREVFNWASAHPDCGRLWEIAGFLDDNPAALDGCNYPVAVLGSVANHHPAADELFICAIGAPSIKWAVCQQLLDRSASFLTLVHPSVIMGANVQLGQGVVLCPGVILTCDIQIGDFAMINCLSSVGHDARIGDWATLSAHCDVTGGAEVGERALLGSGARILPGKKVGPGALVGAGSVVLGNVAAESKVFGNPARVF
ncbi:MAG: acetyltransferase [Puniceicoccaceae bacterium]|nr:MAG: acetyltransferase [Puniceicoccaceae bacterium]